METILIAGGTGLIGKYLTIHLQEKGYRVRILSRQKKSELSENSYFWDITSNYIDENALTNVDFIINLSGENIGSKRWTKKRKQEILASRINSTKLLFNKVQQNNLSLKGYLTASAVGYYGAKTTEKIFIESDKAATDFLGSICNEWEAASLLFSNQNIRTVQIRTGIVLSRNGGVLQKMTQPIKMGFGSILGNGQQYVPWIHIVDLCRLYEFALCNTNLLSAYNAVAPEHVTHKDLTYTLAARFHKKIWLPKLPAFLMKILLGNMSDLVLYGSRISSQKIKEAGFKYRFPTIDKALTEIFDKK